MKFGRGRLGPGNGFADRGMKKPARTIAHRSGAIGCGSYRARFNVARRDFRPRLWSPYGRADLAGKRRNPTTYPLDHGPGRRLALRHAAIGSFGRSKDGQFARGILPAVCRHAGDNRRASRRSRGADKDRPIAALRGPHGCKAHCPKRRTGRRAGAIFGPSRVLSVYRAKMPGQNIQRIPRSFRCGHTNHRPAIPPAPLKRVIVFDN